MDYGEYSTIESQDSSVVNFCKQDSVRKKYLSYLNAGDIADYAEDRRGGQVPRIFSSNKEEYDTVKEIVRLQSKGMSWNAAIKEVTGRPIIYETIRKMAIKHGLVKPSNTRIDHKRRKKLENLALEVDALRDGGGLLRDAVKIVGISESQYQAAKTRIRS